LSIQLTKGILTKMQSKLMTPFSVLRHEIGLTVKKFARLYQAAAAVGKLELVDYRVRRFLAGLASRFGCDQSSRGIDTINARG